jgi:hypothetical protein
MTNVDREEQLASAPAIWNPNAAANWSLIFTPAFGAYIQMINWRSLGRSENAAISQRWFVASLAMLAVYVFVSAAMPDEKAADGAVRGLGFVFLLLWYFINARVQAKYVTARFGKGYARRAWGKPLGLAVLALFGYVLAAVAVGFLLGAVG